MTYKISVHVPIENSGNESLVDKMIEVMSSAGAGRIGNYTRVAYVLKGYETYKGDEGSWDNASKEIETDESVLIEMHCEEDKLLGVIEAIKKIHPYEEPVIELIKLEAFPTKEQ